MAKKNKATPPGQGTRKSSAHDFEVKIYRMGSGYFQAKYRDPKTGERKRKKFNNLKEAKSYKKKIEDLVRSKGVHAFSDLRLSRALDEYLEKFPNSKIRERRIFFRSFIETFGIHRIAEIKSHDLQRWMDKSKQERNLSYRTMRHVKVQFNEFFRYLRAEGHILENPLDEVYFRPIDSPRKKRLVLSVDEVKTILENSKRFCPHILHPYLCCLIHTGARKSEILRLNREDIDFDTGLIHLKETKNGRERFVRISPALEKVLQKHLATHEQDAVFLNEQGKRLSTGQIGRLANKFKMFFPIANKNHWTFHDLRHSFAYNFLKKGGEMYQLQAILGHRSIDVTVDLYGQLQAQDIENPSPYGDEKWK